MRALHDWRQARTDEPDEHQGKYGAGNDRASAHGCCWRSSPSTLAIPSLAALAAVAAVCAFVVAYEAIRHREHRVRVRHPEAAA
jgi:hypothetical protein